MNSEYTLVTNHDELRRACETLGSAEAIGVDCETTDLEPHLGNLRLLQLSDGDRTYILDTFNYDGGNGGYAPLSRLFSKEGPRFISHNAKFEIKWITQHLGIEPANVFDTMLAAQLLDHYGQHSLEGVAKRYIDTDVDKQEQKSDWSGELTRSQLEYAARDAHILVELRQKLRTLLRNEGLIKTAQLEFDCVPALASVELSGIYLDPARWEEQLTIVKRDHARLADELQDLLGEGAAQGMLFGRPEINLDSHTQVLQALKAMGVPLNGSTNNNVIQPLADQYPAVAKLLEYRGVSKNLTSYGQNWLDEINSVTGRIHPNFMQIGAPTGRMSCQDPNCQQVPHTEVYRRCFRAPEGRKLVVVDFSQIELRILAHITRDRAFVDAFNSGADLHKMTAASVFNIPLDQVTKEQRDFAKRLNFGVVYGIGAQRFSNMTGMSFSDAQALLARYFKTYPMLDPWLRKSAQEGIREGFVRTLAGRIVRYNFDRDDDESKGKVKNKFKNGPIQGSSSDIIKRALRLVHDELRGTSAVIVNVVHDEIVVETDAREADEVAQKVSDKMVAAGCEFIKEVPVKADPSVCDEWVKD